MHLATNTKKCPNACMMWLPRLLFLACILSRHHAILCKIESYINSFSRLWLCLMCMKVIIYEVLTHFETQLWKNVHWQNDAMQGCMQDWLRYKNPT